jgi:two-component system, NtrC family, nitrogen regulation sensor histidine kinase NtrY
MKSNRFTLAVVFQSIFLALSGGVAAFIFTGDHLLITKAFFLFLWVIQTVTLIRYVNRTNRELENFLLSLKYLDKVLLTGSGESFKRLNLTYNQIIEIIRAERADRESEHQYFRETVEHVNTGLISYNDDGEISIINSVAKKMLNCGNCISINQLEKINRDLPVIFQSLEPGRPQLHTLNIDNKFVKLSLNLALLKIHNEMVRLVSLTDIKGELEAGELEAWQKLIRILTHEIVNTVTPINTLTTAMISQFKKAGYPDNEHTRNLTSGFKAIKKRNMGLLAFVENFQKVNKVPKPDLHTIGIEELFGNLQLLLQEEFRTTDVIFKLEEHFTMEIDEQLITQVLINLIKNSVEAGAGKIELIGKLATTERPQIMVKDNGHGIDEENLDKIFIPFFSLKREGSGIGLSLSRQIMSLHQGDIAVASTDSSGTSIVLNF